jgi:hypothetical protein
MRKKFESVGLNVFRDSTRGVAALAVFLLLNAASVPGQESKLGSSATAADSGKAEQIVRRGLEAVGGSSYLSVRTATGRGFFTEFKDGAPTVPGRFIDYISYPDKERTEFTSNGVRMIQTNSNGKGWIFDGYTKNLKDQNAAQLDDFKTAMRTSVENLLRGSWRSAGATLSYAGRREAGLGRRNETVRVTYPDGFWVEFEFSAKDGLPAKAIYKRKQKNADDELEEITEEDRLHKPITNAGITTPFVIDHFRNGVQTSRINYDSMEFNRPLADSLFEKPATTKGLK